MKKNFEHNGERNTDIKHRLMYSCIVCYTSPGRLKKACGSVSDLPSEMAAHKLSFRIRAVCACVRCLLSAVSLR